MARAIQTGSDLFLNTHQALVRAFPQSARGALPSAQLQAVAALPLRVSGKTVGGMAFSFYEEHDFSTAERDFLKTLTSLCALAVDRSSVIEAVEKERQLLHALFMDAPACIAIVRRDHRYELSNTWNNATAGGQELTGKTIEEALPELAAQGVVGIIDQVLNTGEPYRFVEAPAVVSIEGTPKHMFFNGVFLPVRGGDGTIEAVANFAFEVTEQVLARRRSGRSRTRHQALRGVHPRHCVERDRERPE